MSKHSLDDDTEGPHKKTCVGEPLEEVKPIDSLPFALLEKLLTDPNDPSTFLGIYGCAPLIMEVVHIIIDALDGCLVERPPIRVFGKECRQPRDVGFFSDESTGYVYSRQTMEAQGLSAAMRELLLLINAYFGTSYNGILINKYNNGNDCIGDHSDDEKGLCPNGGVMSISVGETRTFRIRDKSSKAILLDVLAKDGELIQMAGEKFQERFTHGIPVQRRVKGTRYSLTFRSHSQ